MDLPLTPLNSDDVQQIWPWLQQHLRWHLAHWAAQANLDWSDDDVERRIVDGRLVQREWAALLGASAAPDAVVRVLRRGDRAVGVVHAEERPDRYLGVNVGVLSWLHVAEAERGRGYARPLVEAATAWFQERKLTLAEVFVTAENEAAVKAYARGGFAVVDHRMLRATPEV